mgnify:FL=1
MNRFIKQFSAEYVLQFSPWHVSNQGTLKVGFNRQQNYWDILGVSILDYFDLYRDRKSVV